MTNNRVELFSKNETLSELVVGIKEKGLTNQILISLANTLKENELTLNVAEKRVLEREMKEYLVSKENDLTLEDAVEVIELFSDLSMGNVAQMVLQQFAQEDFEQLRYSVTVSGNDLKIAEEELATIEIKDHWTQRSYSQTIWMDEDTLAPEYTEKGGIGGTYIFVADLSSDDSNQYNLEDYFGKTAASTIEKAIFQAYKNDIDLSLRVSDPKFLREMLPQYVMNDELSRISEKINDKDLKKNDVVTLGRILDRTNLKVGDEDLEFIKQPITDVLTKSKVKPKEKHLLQNVFNTLQFEPNFIKKLQVKNFEMVRG